MDEERKSRNTEIEKKPSVFTRLKRFFHRHNNESSMPELRYFGDNMFSMLYSGIKNDEEYEYTPRIFIKLPETLGNGFNIYAGYVNSDHPDKDDINGLAYSNRSGYYPSADDVIICDSILGVPIESKDLEEEYGKIYQGKYNPIKIVKDSIVNLYLDTDLDLIHEYMMKLVEMTNVGYWEIKVKKSEVVMISDKHRPLDNGKRLMYVLGDVVPVYLDDRMPFESNGQFKKNDRDKFKQISEMIRENFKIDYSEDDYLKDYYL